MSPTPSRAASGRFSSSGQPVAKRVEVWLDEPTLAVVDQAAAALGVGRGKAIAALLSPTPSGQPTPSGPNLEGLEAISHPDAKPLFAAMTDEWLAEHLAHACKSSANRAAVDCRGLALTVRELHRDGLLDRVLPNTTWEQRCQLLFSRPAAWVNSVVDGVRILHGLEP